MVGEKHGVRTNIRYNKPNEHDTTVSNDFHSVLPSNISAKNYNKVKRVRAKWQS